MSLAVPRIILPRKALGYSTTDSWRFVVMSDLHEDAIGGEMPPAYYDPIYGALYPPYTASADAFADIAANIHPDLVLIVGDLVDGASAPIVSLQNQLTNWVLPKLNASGSLFPAGIPVYTVRVNHEAAHSTDPVTGWTACWSGSGSIASVNPAGALPTNGPTFPNEVGLTYSFIHRNSMFIVLDLFISSGGVNQTWLNSQLSYYAAQVAAGNLKHLFVFAHFGAFDLSNMGQWANNLGETTARNTMWSSLVAAHADVYFSGHNHIYINSIIPPSANDIANGHNHSIYHVSDGHLAPFRACIGNIIPYAGSPNMNSPYSPKMLNHYMMDYLYGGPSHPTDNVVGCAVGYMVVEISTKLVGEPRVTYTFRHGVFNSGTKHYSFNNNLKLYQPYNIDKIGSF